MRVPLPNRCCGRVTALLSIALVILPWMGCGSSSSLVPATGSVSVKGKPAAGAMVLFHSQISDAVTPSGAVAEDGTFKLMSGLEPGIAPGKYNVTITWPDPSKKPTANQIMMGLVEPGPDLLKGKYATKATTTLSADITSSTTTIPAFEF